MTDTPKPGILDAKRFTEMEYLVTDLLHRIDDLERRIDALRNPQVVPPHLLPVLNVVPYDPDIRTLGSAYHPDSHS